MYIIYLTTLAYSFIYLFQKYSKRSNGFIVLAWFVLFIFIGTWAFFTDDYNVYIDTVNEAYINPFARFHIESVWIWLAEVVQGEINKFRFITFFTISILLFLIARSANVELKYFSAYYTIFCLINAVGLLRQPVAMCLSLWGMLLMCDKKYLLSIACLFFSCFFHKVGIIYVLLFPACLLPINRKLLWIYFLSLPLLYILFYIILNASSELSTVIFLQSYAQGDGEYASRHVIFKILSTISTLSQFVFLIYTIYHFYESDDKYVKMLIRYILATVIVSIFLFILPLSTGVFVKRLLYFAMMMMVIVWAKCIKGNLLQKRYILMFVFLLIYIAIQLTGTFIQNYTRIGERLLQMPW